ncbi:hypothetical protein DesyoDRAFT_4218 [Desulfosporosinus youngiae DSM 17734]|uniref:Uncharacterized protein n=1 Tax=Desulfosporosinus youngiae DSM 17734 TaxID=768710 RepID=H5XXH0_9FIRM|nr:hypothetical protein DesyoDRAFT_4218 [Desulfosporosinus youngiae DSM 17734]
MPNGSGSIIERYEWAATLIITGEDSQAVWDKREIVLQEIRKAFGITYYDDRCLLIGADQFDSTQTG